MSIAVQEDQGVQLGVFLRWEIVVTDSGHTIECETLQNFDQALAHEIEEGNPNPKTSMLFVSDGGEVHSVPVIEGINPPMYSAAHRIGGGPWTIGEPTEGVVMSGDGFK